MPASGLRWRRLGRLPLSLSCAAAIVALLSLEACREPEGKAAAATAAPPVNAGGPAGAAPAVSVVVVKPETLPVVSEWLATLDGYVNAQIRPQVTGYLIRRAYEDVAETARRHDTNLRTGALILAVGRVAETTRRPLLV